MYEAQSGKIDYGAPPTPNNPWAERGVFRVLLERFRYLPITTASHIGEYLQWETGE
jgi:hypothetical protein